MIKNIFIVALVISLGMFAWMSTRTHTEVVPNVVVSSQTDNGQQTVAQTTTALPAPQPVSGTVLDQSNTGLTSVSQAVFVRTELTTLNLSHNKLSGALPAEVRHLSNLTTLDLSYNNFTGIPAEIGQLSGLKTLNLSHNPITGLPLELGNLSHLQVLNLSGTHYSQADLDQIRKKLPATTVVITE